jgi:hypothetical protein
VYEYIAIWKIQVSVFGVGIRDTHKTGGTFQKMRTEGTKKEEKEGEKEKEAR